MPNQAPGPLHFYMAPEFQGISRVHKEHEGRDKRIRIHLTDTNLLMNTTAGVLGANAAGIAVEVAAINCAKKKNDEKWRDSALY